MTNDAQRKANLTATARAPQQKEEEMNDGDSRTAVVGQVERPVRPHTQDDAHPYTYASTQATNCAGCGEYKHTPLRIDAMGGYVCLTCIDRKLGTLLGEFGYPAPQQPLTDQEIWDAVQHGVVGGIGLPSKAVTVARAIEAAHGIRGA